MDQFTRRIIGFGIHQGDVDGPALCRMFNVAISKQNLHGGLPYLDFRAYSVSPCQIIGVNS
jgi:hypothetical protein